MLTVLYHVVIYVGTRKETVCRQPNLVSFGTVPESAVADRLASVFSVSDTNPVPPTEDWPPNNVFNMLDLVLHPVDFKTTTFLRKTPTKVLLTSWKQRIGAEIAHRLCFPATCRDR